MEFCKDYYLNLIDWSNILFDINLKDLDKMLERHVPINGEKCCCLIRVSTQHQDLIQQTEKVKAEALKDGYDNNNIIIIEDKESAIKLSEAERNGLNKLKHYIEHDNIKCVYVYEISRISRQPSTLYHIRDLLIEHGVQLIVLNPYMKMLKDDGTMSETANIFFGIFSSMAENEMYIKKQRMRRGAEHKHNQGKYWGGQVAIGYKIQDEYLVIDEEGAEWVRRIFNDYAGGISIRSLARQLQAEGWRADTAFLTVCQSILNILHREYYCGDKWHPQIISLELYDRVQQIAKNKGTYKKGGDEALLKGLIYDMNTGYLLSSNMANQQYYSKRYGHCTISMKAADTIFCNVATEWYNAWRSYKKDEMNEQIRINIVRQNNIITNIKDKLNNIYDKIDRITEMYVEGKYSKERADEKQRQTFEETAIYKCKLQEAENEIVRLNEALNTDTDVLTLRDRCLTMIRRIDVERLSRFICRCIIENKMTGEKRTYQINTRTVQILDMQVETRPTLGNKK